MCERTYARPQPEQAIDASVSFAFNHIQLDEMVRMMCWADGRNAKGSLSIDWIGNWNSDWQPPACNSDCCIERTPCSVWHCHQVHYRLSTTSPDASRQATHKPTATAVYMEVLLSWAWPEPTPFYSTLSPSTIRSAHGGEQLKAHKSYYYVMWCDVSENENATHIQAIRTGVTYINVTIIITHSQSSNIHSFIHFDSLMGKWNERNYEIHWRRRVIWITISNMFLFLLFDIEIICI